jgi:uncharacterized protein YfaS (alpha-2-macroglobulin family)
MRYPFAALLVLLAAVACNRSYVTLDYTNAKDEVPQLGNLVFRFSAPLATDSMLNRWDSAEYFNFSPALEGRFRWEAKDQLVFSPARPLPPATSFSATANKALVKNSSFGGVKGADDIAFKTADLTLENTNAYWTLHEGGGSAVPQIDLYFNYQLEARTLAEKLKLTLDGKETQYQLLTAGADNKISMRIASLAPEDRDYKMELTMAAGLKPNGGNNGTAKEQKTETILPSPFILSINEISSEHDGAQGTIYIKTSQPIGVNKLADFIKLEPAVTYSTTLTEDGFTISSEKLSAENTYSLTLLKDLRGVVGGVLKEPYSTSLAFGELEPDLSFTSRKAVYLSKVGARNIELNIVNVPRLKIIVSKVYESNLLAAHQYGYYPAERGDSEEEYYYEGEGNAVLGDVIYEQEIDSRSLPKSAGGRLLNFNLADRLPDSKGIYHIKVRSTQDYWIADSRFVSLSDIGLIARQGADKLLVFANSIQTATSLAGVNVQVYGANNQLLGTATTSADGVAEVPYTRQEYSGFKPAMVIAKTNSDFNYLPFQNTTVNMSRFEVGGKRINPTGLDAFIYPERDIYRPGEIINFNVVLRDREWKVPAEMPLKLKMTMPNGKELVSLRKTIDAQGSAEGNITLSASALTGSYLLEVFTGNDVLLGTRTFKVEEFMPDRIKVDAQLSKESARPGEQIDLSIKAQNYFGPPAVNRKYECEIQVRSRDFAPRKYASYNFRFGSERALFDKIVRTGTTNEGGLAQESFAVPAVYNGYGLLEARFFTTVFDETGRPVSRYAAAQLNTQPYYLGIGNTGYNYFPLRQTVRFPLLALSKTEQPVSGDAEITVIKHEYRTVLSKSGGYFRYQSQREDKVVASATVKVQGEGTAYPFVPASPGQYEIRLSVPGADAYVSRHFYSYGAWGAADANFEVNTDGNVDIALDKDKYAAGEPVKALFKAPFDGRMLVTVETEQVVSYQYVDIKNRSAALTLSTTEKYLPNAYITATLFKPHTVGDMPLTVAHGFSNVMVEDKGRRMNVSIAAATTSRSKTKQKVTVKAAPNAWLTLAAVDNGVLAVSAFRSPDPYAYFFTPRALGVAAYDLYPLLFPEKKRLLSSTGGDADLALSQRMNTMPNKRVKLLSYWSGIKRAGSNGEASFEIDIPQFSGQVRLMAVAYKDNKFGASEATITVADPLVVSSSVPRFLSPGDTLDMPVTIANTTDKVASISASLKLVGPLQVVGEAAMQASAAPKSEAMVLYRIAAGQAAGLGKITIEANGPGGKYSEETDITIRPASTLQRRSGSETIAGTASKIVTINTADFGPQSTSWQLTVSRSPLLTLGSQLQYLVTYPYGCTEQTISVAFPLLYYSDLTDLAHYGQGLQRSALYNVQEAIRKIKMRQLYNGAVALWDNESSESWWTTAYAAHFLIEAKKAGYETDKSLTETMLNYLVMRLRSKEFINYTYNRTQQRKIAPKEVPYSLYVLSLAGRPNLASMNYYKANAGELALDGKYLLAAAYALGGDKAKFRELLPSSFAGEEAVAATGGSFYSEIRDMAVALNALLDADPGNTQIAPLARLLAQKFSTRNWYSTQECAFGLTALGKIARASAKNDATASVWVGGRQIAAMTGAPLRLTQKELKDAKPEIRGKGTGNLYLWWQSQGVSASGSYVEEDRFIKVRRTFYDRYGRQLNGNSFKQNDLVVVKLTVDKAYTGAIENVVVTDILPAGLEIENARIKELPGTEWIKDAATADHTDPRDDRIHFFTNLGGARKLFYYVLRAVSPGTYRMGPVSADAMYNGDIHSYHGSGVVRVVR